VSEIETALAVRLEASLARFERQMARGVQVAADSATGIQSRFDRMNQKVARSAEQSGAVMVRELDKLRAKYDPLFAASQRYEQQLNDLNRAQSLGIRITGGYEAALERLNAEYAASTMSAQAATTRMTGMTAAAGGLSGALSRNSFMITNASNQVADFAVQVAMGTDASRAFAQQAPQLLGSVGMMGGRFGALAGVLGAVVAIGVPLIAMLASSGEEARTLEDRLEDLTSAVNAYRDSAERARMPTAELAERYGSATGAAREFLAALLEIDRVTALDNLRSSLREIATQFGEFQSSIEDGEWAQSPFEETLARIRSALGDISREEAPAVAAALRSLSEAATPDQAVEAARRLLDTLEQALGPYSEMNDEAQALYRAVREAGEEAASLKGAAEGASGALSAAAGQAARLADELTRALGAAAALAAQSVTDLRRAEIEWQFRDNPVGRAGALAAAEFEATRPMSAAMPDGARRQWEADREIYIGNAEAIARMNEQLREYRDNQRDAARGGARQGRQEEAFVRSMAEQIEAAELELDMIGRTAAEVAELTARQELLNEARRRGLDLNARSAETGETLSEQIDRQAEAIGRLTQAQEQANDRAQFFEGIQADLKDGILDAIVAGDDLAGTLENVARALARAALEAALFGSGPLAGLFSRGGSGFVSGIFGMFGGGASAKVMHTGGIVGSGGSSRMVSPAIFAGAQRFHNGGWPGLKAGEVPAILERGERVLSRAEVARGSGSTGGNTTVNVHNYGNQQVEKRERTGANGDKEIDVLIGRSFGRGRQDKVMGRFGVKQQVVRR